ncbi:methyltransferase family protein [Saccharothrix hoggarensis]|uniref:Methyltransferase family protein n=1 Tax=Saccharothrix hoggarensis TaxID=913853 RepID=A0ABW3QS63_9PSEU
MRKSRAAAVSAGFFVVAPGTVVGLVPWLITRWRVRRPLPGAARVVGAVLVAAGLVPATSAFAEFVKAGGTPIPVAPTERLVVSGFNRHVRNPMYLGLLLSIIGQAVLFGNVRLLAYAAAAWAVPAAFVRWYEEPTLARTFGAEYEEYRRSVPAWLPRTTPWTPPAREDTGR